MLGFCLLVTCNVRSLHLIPQCICKQPACRCFHNIVWVYQSLAGVFPNEEARVHLVYIRRKYTKILMAIRKTHHVLIMARLILPKRASPLCKIDIFFKESREYGSSCYRHLEENFKDYDVMQWDYMTFIAITRSCYIFFLGVSIIHVIRFT